VLDLAGVSGAMIPVGKALGKAALREGARQIETGTGIGRAALDPRSRIVQKDLQDAFPDVDFSLSQRGNQATLNKVIVPKEQRGKGVGSEFMSALTKAADTEGTQLALSPSADFGGNKARLVDFYKQFDFVPNKGRKIDFSVSESMRREPQAMMQRPKTEFEILHDTAQRNAALPVEQGGLGLPANNTYIDRAMSVPKTSAGLFDTTGLENRGRELIQGKAEELAQRMRDAGVNVDLQHSGSAAGPSSYLRVAGMPDIRLSGHSKGAFNSQGVINVATPDEFAAVVAQAAKNQSALNNQISKMSQSYEQGAIPIRLASADKKLAKGKSLTKSEQGAVDWRNSQAMSVPAKTKYELAEALRGRK